MYRLLALLSIFCVTGVPLCSSQKNQTLNAQETTVVSDHVEVTVIPVSDEVKAGEEFEFTVRLDKAPNFEGGGLAASFTAVEGNGSASMQQ